MIPDNPFNKIEQINKVIEVEAENQILLKLSLDDFLGILLPFQYNLYHLQSKINGSIAYIFTAFIDGYSYGCVVSKTSQEVGYWGEELQPDESFSETPPEITAIHESIADLIRKCPIKDTHAELLQLYARHWYHPNKSFNELFEGTAMFMERLK